MKKQTTIPATSTEPVKPPSTGEFTTEDAKKDNLLLFQGLADHFDEQEISKWPVPSRSRRYVKGLEEVKKERLIARGLKLFGFKFGLYGGITNAWRERFWSHLDTFYRPELSDEQKGTVLWDAWCVMIGIPTPGDLERMHEFLSDDMRNRKEREVDVMVLATVCTGTLFCKDYAELAEFLMWYTGNLCELKWTGEAWFIDPVRQSLYKQHPALVEMAEAILDGESITPSNLGDYERDIVGFLDGKALTIKPVDIKFEAGTPLAQS